MTDKLHLEDWESLRDRPCWCDDAGRPVCNADCQRIRQRRSSARITIALEVRDAMALRRAGRSLAFTNGRFR